jgi:membrane associated rhomboid family serine protease
VGIVVGVAALWVCYTVDWVLPTDFTAWGLVPRTARGLLGIATMPFLHGSFGHLTSNTVPLVVLLGLLIGTQSRAWTLVAAMVGLGGLLLWLLGRPAVHVGASVLVYSLIGYLLTAALFHRRWLSLSVAVVVLLIYGGSLLWGVLPMAGKAVSWEGHLCGALAGALLAYSWKPMPSNDAMMPVGER